jgi:stage V sporulation protein B
MTRRITMNLKTNDRAAFVLGVAICFGGLIYVISMLFIKGISKDDVVMLPKGEKIAKILAKYGFIE